MELTEKKIKSNVIYNGRILNVKCDDVLLPNGQESKREVIEHNGGSCVLAIKEDKILFVKQFRYAVNEILYEIPAGKLEKGEDPKDTAIRELNEEGGLIAKDLSLLYVMYPTPAYTEEKIYIYKAEEFVSGKMHLDDNEFLVNEWIDCDTAYKMTLDGRIKDAKTIIAVQRYWLEKFTQHS